MMRYTIDIGVRSSGRRVRSSGGRVRSSGRRVFDGIWRRC